MIIAHYIVGRFAVLVPLPNAIVIRIDHSTPIIKMSGVDSELRFRCLDIVRIPGRTIKKEIDLCSRGEQAYEIYTQSFLDRSFISHDRHDFILDPFFDLLAETHPQKEIIQWLLSHRDDWETVTRLGDTSWTRWDHSLIQGIAG